MLGSLKVSVGVLDHRMVCLEDTRIILVRAEHSYIQSAATRVTGTVCSRGYRWAREGADPRSQVEGLKSAESLFSCSAMCSCLCPCVVLHCVPPLIEEGEDAGYIRKREEREKEGENRGEEALWDHHILLLLHAGPIDVVDGDRDGSMLASYSPLVLCLDVISWSWRSIPSR